MSLIWNPKVMAGLPVIANTDHPLSLGRTLFLVSRHELLPKKDRCSAKQWNHLWAGMKPTQGMHAIWDEIGVAAIVIESTPQVTKTRLIELIVHECSHAVDEWFKGTRVRPCTEVRAYYLDWVVGKTVSKFNI